MYSFSFRTLQMWFFRPLLDSSKVGSLQKGYILVEKLAGKKKTTTKNYVGLAMKAPIRKINNGLNFLGPCKANIWFLDLLNQFMYAANSVEPDQIDKKLFQINKLLQREATLNMGGLKILISLFSQLKTNCKLLSFHVNPSAAN